MSESQSRPWYRRVELWIAGIVGGIISNHLSVSVYSLLTSQQFFFAALTLVGAFGLAMVFQYMREKEHVSLINKEFGVSDGSQKFIKMAGIIAGLLFLFALANFIVLISSLTILELLEIGSTHTERLNLLTDVMGIAYSAIALVLIIYLGYMLLRLAPTE